MEETHERKLKVRLNRLMHNKSYIDIEVLGNEYDSGIKKISWAQINQVGVDYIELIGKNTSEDYKTIIIPINKICIIAVLTDEAVKEYFE